MVKVIEGGSITEEDANKLGYALWKPKSKEQAIAIVRSARLRREAEAAEAAGIDPAPRPGGIGEPPN